MRSNAGKERQRADRSWMLGGQFAAARSWRQLAQLAQRRAAAAAHTPGTRCLPPGKKSIKKQTHTCDTVPSSCSASSSLSYASTKVMLAPLRHASPNREGRGRRWGRWDNQQAGSWRDPRQQRVQQRV